jgi:hypothetical protein
MKINKGCDARAVVLSSHAFCYVTIVLTESFIQGGDDELSGCFEKGNTAERLEIVITIIVI